MNRERIYAVTFNSYTNGLRNTVSDGNKDIGKTEYLSLSQDIPFLIRESELLYYSKFGKGYSMVKCVGELSEKEIDKIRTDTATPIKTNQFDENNSTVSKVQDITVGQTDSAVKAISSCIAGSFPKRCGNCDKTDGMCYTSNPPQVKCKITGSFHCYDDTCDCDTITATN